MCPGNDMPPVAGNEGQPAGRSARPCPHNCVTAVSIFDGEDGRGRPALAQQSVKQFVNLPAEDRFLDLPQGVTRHTDRASRTVHLWVDQQLPGNVSFDMRIVPGQDRAGYSEEEAVANAEYQFSPSAWRRVNGGGHANRFGIAGTEIEAQVAAHGGQTFQVQIRCAAPGCSTSFTSTAVEVKRRMWVHPVALTRQGATVRIPSLSGVKSMFRDLQIFIRELDRADNIPFVYTGSDCMQRLYRAIRPHYEGSGGPDKEPYVMVVAFVDQIATKRPYDLTLTNQEINRRRGNIVVECPEFIWWDMGESDQWLRPNSYFRPRVGQPVDITRDMLTPLPGDSTFDDGTPIPESGRSKIRINVGPIFSALDGDTAGSAGDTQTGTIRLNLNTAQNFINGFRRRNANIVVAAWRYMWSDRTANEVRSTLNHELGHALHMVPQADQTTCGLDRVPTGYTGHDHTGPHCHYGLSSALASAATYGEDQDQEARCLMYGQAGSRRTQFCDNCAAAVRKVGLSEGWGSFPGG